jgi:TRAP-type C4-dicarboxylate transport system substrate-binding protein
LIPAAQAAAPDKIYDAAVSGLIDIADQHLGGTPGRFPLMGAVELPFIFEDPSSRSASLTCMALAEKYPEIREQFGDTKLLGFHFTGQCHFFTTKKPINTLEDVEGQLILTVGRGSSTAVELLGGVPQPADPMQIYDMLSKGVVDGMAISWFGAQIFNISSVCDYATVASLPDAPFVIGMNMDTWNSLPDDLKQLFTGDNFMQLVKAFGYDFDVYATTPAIAAIDQDLKSRDKPGVVVLSAEEQARFIETLAPQEQAWVDEAAAVAGEDLAKAILADTKALAKEYSFDTNKDEELEALLKSWGTAGY